MPSERRERLEGLRQELIEGGLVEGHQEDPGTAPESFGVIRPAARFDEDTRTDHRRCCICLRTIHAQRKVKMAEGQWACRICASQDQEAEWVLRHWLATPLELRRLRLTQHFGFDPITVDPSPTMIEFVSVSVDVDGAPAGMESETTTHKRVPVFGTPRCYWSVVGDRARV